LIGKIGMASDTSVLPAISVDEYVADPNSPAALEACKRIAQVLHITSCLIIRDSRVPEEKNQKFLDMMEQYFLQSWDQLKDDIHPELSYQVGATPEYVEVPRNHADRIKLLTGENAPHIPHGADAKWRFFWRLGERPQSTAFPELNAAPVVPKHFPAWINVMNDWGSLMLQTEHTVAEMAAIGLGLPKDSFTKLMKYGPHLLAPTGSDIKKHSHEDVILAGFHYDLNFLTIHGKSRFPGLYIWLRDGTKYKVTVPDGCLLLQAGKQFEWLTGGHITAGFHEVVVTADTLAVKKKREAEGKPLWRISSTVFGHIASDATLTPLGSFATAPALANYHTTKAGDQVNDELTKISLASPQKSSK